MFANKDRYSGSWKKGLKHGKGTYIINEVGIKLVGEWFEGKILEGDWNMENGSIYEGQFHNNKPNGVGVWYLSNGNKVVGEYTQQILEKTNKVIFFFIFNFNGNRLIRRIQLIL